jgi:hypothetical protein
MKNILEVSLSVVEEIRLVHSALSCTERIRIPRITGGFSPRIPQMLEIHKWTQVRFLVIIFII